MATSVACITLRKGILVAGSVLSFYLCHMYTNRPEQPEREIRRRPIQKEKPPSRPETPEEPKEKDPEGPGFIFGFWKERYPDDDKKNPTNLKTLPTPGDMNYHYPHTYDPVNGAGVGPAPPGAPTQVAPGQAAPAAEAATSTKRCVIQ